MTDRERLIELIVNADTYDSYECKLCAKDDDACDCCFAEKLADHLLANGVIVPPCKVGDTMYKVCTVNSRIQMGQLWDGKIVKTNCDRCGYRNCHCYDIGLRKHDPDTMIDVIVPKIISSLEFAVKIMPYVGTVWFNTEEEAEQALKERESNA